AQEKLAAERLAQIQERAQAELVQAGLWAEKETEIAQLQATLQDAIGRAVGLEAQLAEMGINQSLQREEVVKAEAQIELIKDILLRREGL
ncbi:MAG: hypothetical protein CRU78_04565, partial [Candidatus Accumulibacter phosphatis]|nr:hypothetical protein [Candidatus Accumulibacter phosphatis]